MHIGIRIRFFNGCVRVFWASAFLLMLFQGAVYASAPRRVSAARVHTPPVIDGIIEEDEWKDSRWHTGFLNLGDGQTADVQTRFKVVHDNNYVYFGIELEEPSVSNMRARITEYGGTVWRDDCIEIFLDPNGYEIEYFQIVINSLGTVFDAELRQGGHIVDPTWASEARVASRVADDRWFVEAAVPLVNLGLTEASEEGWRFNIARERYAGESPELSTYSDLDYFHRPDSFSVLYLEQPATERFFWEISPLIDEGLVMEDGRLHYAGEILLTNNTGSLKLAGLKAELTHEEAGVSSFSGAHLVNPGQTVQSRFKIPVLQEGSNVLRVTIFDRRDDLLRYAVRSYPLNILYSPIEISLSSPPYRNNIYSTQKIDYIEGMARINLPPEALAGKVLVYRLHCGNSGNVIVESENKDPGLRTPFRLSAAGLDIGDYNLELSLKSRGTEGAGYSSELGIRKLPPPEAGNEVWFDEHGACYVNGEPFLPYGHFNSIGPPHPSFNTAQHYHNVSGDMLDRHWESGIFVVPEPFLPGDKAQADPRRHRDRLYTEEELEFFRKAVEKYMGHPALLAWYLVDEPHPSVIPERLFQAYELIREIDPYHPVIILDDTVQGQYRYAHCADILMPDPYPGFLRGGHSSRGIDSVTTFIRAARDAGGGNNPVWFTPQWFSWWRVRHSSQPEQRHPNFRELRNMHYQAVIQGGTGIIGFNSRGWRHDANVRLALPFLGDEKQLLKGAILSPGLDGKFSFEADNYGDKFFWSYREHAGNIYIFAVNTATEKIRVRGKFEDGFRGDLYVVSAGEKLIVRDGAFTDVFDIYDTKIYTTDPDVADVLSIDSLEKEIDKLYSEIGPAPLGPDLARWERGVKVSASYESRHRMPLFAVDGIYSIEKPLVTGWKEKSEHYAANLYYNYEYWQADRGKPDWLLIEFPQRESFARVVLYTPNISDFSLQIRDGGAWRDISTVRGNREERVEVVFDSPVESDVLRIFITGTSPDDGFSIIGEVKVYEK